MFKKRFFLSLALKYRIFYTIYLYYNLYIRNFKYIFQKSYSQFNDDIFIKKFFQNKIGTYVDIGCHHPFKLNNTYLLYKKRQNGLNIDLMKINIDLFKKHGHAAEVAKKSVAELQDKLFNSNDGFI